MADYYSILGIKRDASEDDIKSTYRELAKKYHPDANPNADETIKKENEEKFKEINEAYSVLSDPEKRKQYDNPRPQPQFHPGFNPFFHVNVEDILNQVRMGRMGGGINININNAQSTTIISTNLVIPVSKAILGGEVEIQNIPNIGHIKFNLPEGVQPGQEIKVRIKKDGNSEVILQVNIQVRIPTGINDAKRRLISKMKWL